MSTSLVRHFFLIPAASFQSLRDLGGNHSSPTDCVKSSNYDLHHWPNQRITLIHIAGHTVTILDLIKARQYNKHEQLSFQSCSGEIQTHDICDRACENLT